MTDAPIPISSPDLLPALEQNLAYAWTSLRRAPGISINESPECITYTTGLPAAFMNRVHCARLPADDAAIKRVLHPFISQGIPLVWSVGPSDTPSDLGERLLRAGLTGPTVAPGMAVDLARLEEEPLAPGLEISEVKTPDEWTEFGRVVCESFSMPRALAEPFTAIVRDAYAVPDSSVAAFLGRLNGTPVASSQVVMQHGVAGVFSVGTLAEARGKGIGRAITMAACLHGKSHGYETAILASSELGHSVYQRMGFEDRCKLGAYTWTPA